MQYAGSQPDLLDFTRHHNAELPYLEVNLFQSRLPLPQSPGSHEPPLRHADVNRSTFVSQYSEVRLEEELPELQRERVGTVHEPPPEGFKANAELLATDINVDLIDSWWESVRPSFPAPESTPQEVMTSKSTFGSKS